MITGTCVLWEEEVGAVAPKMGGIGRKGGRRHQTNERGSELLPVGPKRVWVS